MFWSRTECFVLTASYCSNWPMILYLPNLVLFPFFNSILRSNVRRHVELIAFSSRIFGLANLFFASHHLVQNSGVSFAILMSAISQPIHSIPFAKPGRSIAALPLLLRRSSHDTRLQLPSLLNLLPPLSTSSPLRLFQL